MHKLLLADDNVTIQRMVALTFARENLEVIAVGDGEEAIARMSVERPDIVLADIEMPKRNGYDVAEYLRAQPDLAHVPVLLLAGAYDPVDAERATRVGCNGVVIKPFDPVRVAARVRELLAGAEGAPTEATAAVPRPIDRLTATAPDRQAPLDVPRLDASLDAPSLDAPSLDTYFDELDAAFASLTPSTPGAPCEADDDVPIPTLDGVLADVTSQAAHTLSPDPLGQFVSEDDQRMRCALTDAISGTVPHAASFDDAALDDLTRRVVARLAPDRVRAVVADVVSEVAERLVREEIHRIRTGLRPLQ